MGFWVQFILSTALGILRAAIRNPAHLAGVEHFVVEVRDTACSVALQLDPAVAPPPGYKAA
jgi:hypothetical protein